MADAFPDRGYNKGATSRGISRAACALSLNLALVWSQASSSSRSKTSICPLAVPRSRNSARTCAHLRESAALIGSSRRRRWSPHGRRAANTSSTPGARLMRNQISAGRIVANRSRHWQIGVSRLATTLPVCEPCNGQPSFVVFDNCSFSCANAGFFGANVLLASQSASRAVKSHGTGAEKGDSG